MSNAPIIVTVYDRVEHLRMCIESLQNCDLASDTVLFISSDYPSKEEHLPAIRAVRSYINEISGFKKVIKIFHNNNKGLEYSFNYAVQKVQEVSNSFIFLEDDVIVAPYFLKYMNAALDFYEFEPKVVSISAFSHSALFQKEISGLNQNIYFTNRWCPWGFATWKSKFREIETLTFDVFREKLRNDRFKLNLNLIGIDLFPYYYQLLKNRRLPVLDLKYCFNMVLNDYYTVTPYHTLSLNIGNDGSGTRTAKSKKHLGLNKSNLNETAVISFATFNKDLINNSFNYRCNLTALNKFKYCLTELRVIHIAYRAKELWKKVIS